MARLNPQTQLFVQEYLVDLNASAAAKRAGYIGNNYGNRLMMRKEVREAVELAMEDLSQRTKVTQEWVINNLKSVAERCMQAEPVLDKEGKPTGEYRFDSSGANKALELLGKHLKLFTDKVEQSGELQLVLDYRRTRNAD